MSKDILFLAEFAGGKPARPALELATGAAELAAQSGGAAVALAYGPGAAAGAAGLGAQGAARAIVLGDEDRPAVTYAAATVAAVRDADALAVLAPATPNGRDLAAALDKLAPDVSLMGMASDDARGSLVPGAVAAMRDVPLLSYGSELKLTDGAASVRRLSATGFDWITAPLPVVATVTDQVGEPRYASLKGIMAAKRKPLETWSLGDLGLSADELSGAALTRVTDARAPEAKPPTERIEGLPAAEAATKIADWLEQRKLI